MPHLHWQRTASRKLRRLMSAFQYSILGFFQKDSESLMWFHFAKIHTDVAWQLDALPTASSLTPPLGTAPLASHSEIPHVCVMIFMTKLCACMPDALCSNLCNCPGYHHFAENENPPACTSWACLATKPQGQFLAESDTPGPNEASGGVQ